MKRVYPCYHFSCNPCVFIVLSSACGSRLTVELRGKQVRSLSPLASTLCDSRQNQS